MEQIRIAAAIEAAAGQAAEIARAMARMGYIDEMERTADQATGRAAGDPDIVGAAIEMEIVDPAGEIGDPETDAIVALAIAAYHAGAQRA